ncbi:MarR family transcriptional regulator [Agromyces atrinae]|uniref:MarR family winged helix-turn-helix transcriptional regulator n=1 Tax=Agromyces atrinae TaxID=592376 RepID=UPI001F56057F|nr:MarR family transcriptional regulator [Agromyces atrinae]MCI2958460.1 MarR family transcriptional regulator [Agromyces atrinae]
MARTPAAERNALDPSAFRPIEGADGPTLSSALHAIVTYANSTALRQQVMSRSDFPFPGDLSAFLVVNQLIYRGSARPTDLANALDTGRSNISKILARLESADLVTRGTDPADNRGVVVVLTPAGRELGARILSTGPRAATLETWTSADAARLEELVIKLAQHLDAAPDHPLATTTGLAFPRGGSPT